MPMHGQAVEKEYQKKGATLQSQQLVEFEIHPRSSAMITLNISLDGMSIQGWKITPILRPVVSDHECR